MLKRILITLALCLICSTGYAFQLDSPVSFTGVAAPTLIQHLDVNSDGATAALVKSMDVMLPNPSLSGNCIIVSVFWIYGVAISGVTDNKSNSYGSAVTSVTYGTNSQLSVYVCPNATAGVQDITITWASQAAQYIAVKVTEFAGVAASSPVDTSQSFTVNSATIQNSSNISPGTSGDLLYMVGFTGLAAVGGTYVAGSGQSNITWQLVPGSVNSYDASYVQYGQYNSTAAFAPKLTCLTGSTTNLVGIVALKSASAGTLPAAGIRVVAALHLFLNNLSSASPVQFVTQGNLQVCLSTSGDGIGPVSGAVGGANGITSTGANTNSWTSRVAAQQSIGTPSYGQVLDSVNTAAGSSILTINFVATTAGYHDVVLLDVAGATATPYDTYASFALQNQTSGTTLNINTGTGNTITPTQSNGLVVIAVPVAEATLDGFSSPSGAIPLTCAEHPMQEPTQLDENNGYGIYYNPNTSPILFKFTTDADDPGPVGLWGAGVVAYK
jgi:hypothetical protein